MISLLCISPFVILRLAPREPAHNNGCGPLPKKLDTSAVGEDFSAHRNY